MRLLPLFLATYFLLGSLLPRTDFSQLTKVADLLGHYQEHQLEAEEALSFLDFLCMHFIHPDHHEETGHDHQNLPLKSIPAAIDLMINNLFLPHFSNTPPKFNRITFLEHIFLSEFIFTIFIPPAR